MKPELPAILLLLLAATAAAQTEYTGDGIPTERSEEIRWHLNRGRFDPAAENTLRGTSYSGLTAVSPVAPNAILDTAARYHALDMAANNLMTHTTFLGSPYFPNAAIHRSNSIPDFFDRATDLGYAVNGGNENVAYASPSSALSTYLAWWNSSSHRNNMFASHREIGLGNGKRVEPTMTIDFDAMTLANQDAINGYFTGTIFRDLNANNAYGAGEGISGVKIEITWNGNPHNRYDISSPVGSFAVPLNGTIIGDVIDVFLTNTTGSPLSLSIPLNHATLRPVTLPAGQRWRAGTFTRLTYNYGFRNLTANPSPPILIPVVNISTTTGQAVISFPSQTGNTYQVQWSADLSAPWTNLGSLQNGNNGTLSVTDPASTTSPTRRFYKVIITSP